MLVIFVEGEEDSDGGEREWVTEVCEVRVKTCNKKSNKTHTQITPLNESPSLSYNNT